MDRGKKPNRLYHEKSPYLLQHAFNPVDWYPWGDEAFAKALNEKKPIFLSIGYSTCHWCHVMERESFEVDSIAAIMNRYFVCIKVDREERPDVDRVYMNALQGMGQNGGWPLSMFLTPDLKPFYGGTYFPPETRHGRIGFPDLLKRVHDIWEKEHEKILESANDLTAFLQKLPAAASGSTLGKSVLDTCFAQLSKTYDAEFGGFGNGPKFPRPAVFNFLLRYFHRTGEARALEMTAHTLTRMYEGGMYDHIGGGFHRYSVDGEWRVPHFEKMLYDQAQLANAYVDLYQITHDPTHASIVNEVLGYVLRDMTNRHGGFYSAEDADSPRPEAPEEEGEGAFYVWTKKEILALLGEDAGEILCYHTGVKEAGNVPVDPQHEFTGRNILYVAHSQLETAKKFGMSDTEIFATLSASRERLFAERLKRPRPRLDDKILTSWNGLMIGAFARAYQVLEIPAYLEASRRAARFILSRLYDPHTVRLRRRFRDGEAKFEAQLDDYAFLVQGLIDLYEASHDLQWFLAAVDLTKVQIELFWDGQQGGFFDTSGKDSSILVRMKEQYDGAEPSGNAIAAMNLLRLSQMTDNRDWRTKAEQTSSLFGDVLLRQPVVMPQMVAGLDFSLSKPKQIVIAGKPDDHDTRRLLREIHSRYIPNKILLFADGGEEQRQLAKTLPFVSSMTMQGGKPTAYICEDYVCQLPASDVADIAKILDQKK